jgi:D-alanine--poly(phosphoribitol) ligase subunit 2
VTPADPAVTERVQRIFLEALGTEVPSPETDVIDTGLLDSLALVELIFAIEREFEVEIPPDGFDIESFRTVGRIAEFIADRRGLEETDAA